MHNRKDLIPYLDHSFQQCVSGEDVSLCLRLAVACHQHHQCLLSRVIVLVQSDPDRAQSLIRLYHFFFRLPTWIRKNMAVECDSFFKIKMSCFSTKLN